MQPGGWVRVLVAGGVLAASVFTATAARAMGDPVDPVDPTIATSRAELGRRSARTSARPDANVLAFAGGTTREPLQAAGSGGPAAAARRFVDRYAPAFGATNAAELVAPDVERTPTGDGVRFQQQHRGVDVLGGQMSVQLGRDGAVLSATGRLATGLKLDVTPAIDADAAAATAVALTAKVEEADAGSLTATTPELAVFDPALWGVDDQRGARIVWSTAARTDLGDVNRLVLVDAHDGTIALDFSQVHTGRQRIVCDQQNAALASPPGCTVPVRSEGQGASPVTDVNQAYDFAGVTYDFYFDVLGRDSVDGAGLPLRSTVRVCVQGEACPYPNAYWDNVLDEMFYGEGFAVADDVVAHELTHGVTDFTSQLFYYAQSGAINESLSDVFGELVDRTTPDAGGPGLMGEDIAGGAIRDMSNPPAFNDPDRMRSPLYWLASGDSGGVHFNSGVNNKAAFLLMAGGTFNGQTVTAIGDVKTAHVYYLAQTTMLTALSQYSDLANMLPQACRNLIGQHGIVETDCQQVDTAVTATEMRLPPDRASLAAPSTCVTPGALKNRIIAADDQGTAASWTFSTSVPGVLPSFEDGTVPGNRVLFVPEPTTDGEVAAAWQQEIAVPASGETILTVKHLVAMEPNWDGGVVEYTTDGTAWQDLEGAVGSGNVTNGYNEAVIPDATTNPLATRAVFSDESLGFTVTRYQLAPLAGQTIRLRFRVGSDDSFAVLGWIIDDIAVYGCGAAQVPAAPPSVTATPASGQATVSWTAPFDGGSALTGYTVTPVLNGVPQAPRDVAAGVTSTTFTGLTNGAAYRFAVAARNGVGTGLATSSATIVPGAVPGPPATPAVTRDGTSVTLTWSAPVSDAPITGFSIVPSRNGVPQPAVAVGAVTQHTIAGLAPGSYTFTVAATSGVGPGPASPPSNAVMVFAPFTPVTPARVLETRPGLVTADGRFNGIGVLAAGSITPVQIADRAGVPADASAVALNVTVTDARGAGFVTLFPCGVDVPNASNLNFQSGATVPNMVVSKLGIGGQVCIYTPTATHLLIDVNGFFPAGAALTPIVPARVLETRPGLPTIDGQLAGIGIRGAGTVTEVRVAGRADVPADAAAVVLNVTVTDTAAPGFATVYPCGGDVPTASNLNHGAGVTVPNATITKVGANGSICIFTWAPTHLLVDVTGWFPAGADLTPLVPARLLDSRQGVATTDGLFNGIGVRQPGVVTILQVTDRGGVPVDATAVALNVTVADTQAPGFVTVFPCRLPPPTASNLNFGVGTTIANAVLAEVGTGGQVCFYSEAAHHLIVDVNGYVTG